MCCATTPASGSGFAFHRSTKARRASSATVSVPSLCSTLPQRRRYNRCVGLVLRSTFELAAEGAARLRRDALPTALPDHIWDRAQYYDQLSRDVLGRSVPHTLLIHYNLPNSLFLGNLVAMFYLQG